jgi:putative phosphoesterase
MKVLVVSDIHANWPALQAIREAADAVVCLGDLVSYGPFPRECIQWVRDHAAYVIRGNHDTALGFGVDPRVSAAARPLANATLLCHRQALSADEIAFLRDLPTEIRLLFDGFSVAAVHASPTNHLFDWHLTPDMPDEDLATAVKTVDTDLLLLGHTHLPMQRRIGTMLVLNPGSVGQPLDADPRASYAVIQDGAPEIRRVPYDLDATVAGIRAMGLAADVVAGLIAILKTGKPVAGLVATGPTVAREGQ